MARSMPWALRRSFTVCGMPWPLCCVMSVFWGCAWRPCVPLGPLLGARWCARAIFCGACQASMRRTRHRPRPPTVVFAMNSSSLIGCLLIMFHVALKTHRVRHCGCCASSAGTWLKAACRRLSRISANSTSRGARPPHSFVQGSPQHQRCRDFALVGKGCAQPEVKHISNFQGLIRNCTSPGQRCQSPIELLFAVRFQAFKLAEYKTTICLARSSYYAVQSISPNP